MPRRIQNAAAQRQSDGGTTSLVAAEPAPTTSAVLPVDLIASGEVEVSPSVGALEGATAEELDAALQERAVAPRVTLDHLESVIVRESFFQPEGTALTICVLHLRNGFTVTGESAAASLENFDAGIGRDLARKNAKQKIWPLEGYLLRQRLHEAEAA